MARRALNQMVQQGAGADVERNGWPLQFDSNRLANALPLLGRWTVDAFELGALRPKARFRQREQCRSRPLVFQVTHKGPDITINGSEPSVNEPNVQPHTAIDHRFVRVIPCDRIGRWIATIRLGRHLARRRTEEGSDFLLSHSYGQPPKVVAADVLRRADDLAADAAQGD